MQIDWSGVVVLSVIVLVIFLHFKEKKKISLMSPDEKKQYEEEKQRLAMQTANKNKEDLRVYKHGSISPQLICPHCQTKGKVRTKHITQKKGVSGGKATAAVLTGGVSLLAVGLSRKEGATQSHCDNCNSNWVF